MLCAALLLLGALTMAEPKYYIVPPFERQGQWMTRPEIATLFNGRGSPPDSADHIIEQYEHGTFRGSGGFEPSYDGEGPPEYKEIPMSSLRGGTGFNTLAGGNGREPKYFNPASREWWTRKEVEDGLVPGETFGSFLDWYNSGGPGIGLKRDPNTGEVINFEEWGDDLDPYEHMENIPMSSLRGGEGSDTLMGGTYSVERGENTKKVDPRLVHIMQEAAKRSPYNVEIISGKRYGLGASRHNTGNALDTLLVDPNTGAVVPNLRSETAFPIYQEFTHLVKEVQEELYPELSNQMRWGGGFEQGVNFDLMHYDLKPGQSMKYYDWQSGQLTPVGEKALARLGDNRAKAYGAAGRPTTYANLWGREPQQIAPAGSPALGARLAAEEQVPPSYPTLDETVALLAERGYTGPDAVMRFQEENMGLAGKGGRTGPEFFAALTNPDLGGAHIRPTARPSRAEDFMVAGGVSGIPTRQAARTEAPVERGLSTEVAGAPTPRSRPAGPVAPPAMATAEPPPGTVPASGRIRPEPVAAAPAPDLRNLRLGDRGEDVLSVQSQLSAAGFNPGKLDSIYGPKTAYAVMKFQEAAEAERPGWVGGKVDAIAGPYTQTALRELTGQSTWVQMGGSPESTKGILSTPVMTAETIRNLGGTGGTGLGQASAPFLRPQSEWEEEAAAGLGSLGEVQGYTRTHNSVTADLLNSTPGNRDYSGSNPPSPRPAPTFERAAAQGPSTWATPPTHLSSGDWDRPVWEPGKTELALEDPSVLHGVTMATPPEGSTNLSPSSMFSQVSAVPSTGSTTTSSLPEDDEDDFSYSAEMGYG